MRETPTIDFDRRRTAEEWRQSIREAEALAHLGTWEHDLITGKVFSSDENLRLFFGEDRSKGMRFDDYAAAVHPDDRARMMADHAILLAEGGPRDMEFRVVRPDGGVHVLSGRATVVRDDAGQAVRVYGTNLDVTERRRAEETMRESRQLLDLVLATLPVGVAVTDHGGDIILANAAAERIWGDVIVSGSKRWAESKGFWHDSGKRIAAAEWASVRALRRGETSVRELIDIETFDGQRKTIQNFAAPIRKQGRIVGTVIVNEDVSERVRAEKALQESAQRLHHLSRRLLAVQEEDRRRFSRELHDEFGQLLATMNLHLHAAKKLAGEAAQPILEQCDSILQHAGMRMRSLALELRPAMLDTAGLDATLRWLAGQNQQVTGIATEVVGHLGEVTGDVAIALFRVAQEALTNVARHARARHAAIELSHSESALEMVVRDDGVGFDVEEALDHAAGRGRLGLLGMWERVQILGGKIEWDSDRGRGTRIRVSLPVTETAPEPGESAA